MRQITQFLGLKRSTVGMLAMVILVGMGEKMAERFLPMNKRTMGVSMHSLVRRIPMALGPVLGGLCIGFGVLGTIVFAIRGKDLKGEESA